MSDILALPEDDEDYLSNRGITYELHRHPTDTTAMLMVIRQYNLGPHFNPQVVDFSLNIPAGYPDAQLDMFWVYPSVVLRSGAQPRATSLSFWFEGHQWQQFSRHRDPSTPWRPGIDSIASHLLLVRGELDKGI